MFDLEIQEGGGYDKLPYLDEREAGRDFIDFYREAKDWDVFESELLDELIENPGWLLEKEPELAQVALEVLKASKGSGEAIKDRLVGQVDERIMVPLFLRAIELFSEKEGFKYVWSSAEYSNAVNNDNTIAVTFDISLDEARKHYYSGLTGKRKEPCLVQLSIESLVNKYRMSDRHEMEVFFEHAPESFFDSVDLKSDLDGLDIKVFRGITEKEVDLKNAKENWQECLKKLSQISPETLDDEKIDVSEGIKLFRGTSICDILYAVLENGGKLVSPLSYSYYEQVAEDNLGTILTDSIVEAVNHANKQLMDSDLRTKKIKWMASATGLSEDEVARIGGLWQPVLLEITKHIPQLEVENHYAEIWTKKPINILRGSVSEKTMEFIIKLIGINIRELQSEPIKPLADEEIEEMIRLSDKTNEMLWENVVPDDSILPDEIIDDYWDEERRRQLGEKEEKDRD